MVFALDFSHQQHDLEQEQLGNQETDTAGWKFIPKWRWGKAEPDQGHRMWAKMDYVTHPKMETFITASRMGTTKAGVGYAEIQDDLRGSQEYDFWPLRENLTDLTSLPAE